MNKEESVHHNVKIVEIDGNYYHEGSPAHVDMLSIIEEKKWALNQTPKEIRKTRDWINTKFKTHK